MVCIPKNANPVDIVIILNDLCLNKSINEALF